MTLADWSIVAFFALMLLAPCVSALRASGTDSEPPAL
jgi:hypothetical protein